MGFLSAPLSKTNRWRPMSLEEWVNYDDAGAPSYAGVNVSRESAMRVSTIFACYRIITNTFVGLPVDTFSKQDEDLVLYRPRPRWLLRPNAEQLWPEFISQVVGSLVSDGNYFIDIRRLPNLFVLDPRKVLTGRVISADGGLQQNELIYTVGGTIMSRRDILHLRGVSLPGSDRGLSPIDAARQEAGISLAAQRFQASFFRNGATVSAVLEMPLGATRDQAELVRDMWQQEHGGSENAHKVGVLPGAAYKPMAITQEQAQFLESRDFSVLDIGTRIFGIPAHRLGVVTKQTSFGVGMESQNNSLVADAILPPAGLAEAGLSTLLPGDVHLLFDLNGIMRGDSRARSAYYTAGIGSGWLCQDDARKAEGFNPIPGGLGKVFRTQQTLIPLDSEPITSQGGEAV